MRILTSLAAAAVATAALMGCDALGEAGGTSGASPEDAVPSNVELGDQELRMLDTGDGPTRVLRTLPDEGTRASTTMTVDQNVTANGQPVVTVPTSTFLFDTEVVAVDDDGVDIVATYGAPEVDGDSPEADTLRQLYDGFEGASVSETLTSSGSVSDVETSIPDDANPALSSLLEQLGSQADQLTSFFPDEAVGVGARWEVSGSTDLDLQGIAVSTEQTATYTLESLRGDRYVLTSEIDGTIDSADTESFTVDGGHIDGVGRTVGVLGALAPTSSRTDVHTSVRVSADGESETVENDTSYELHSQ